MYANLFAVFSRQSTYDASECSLIAHRREQSIILGIRRADTLYLSVAEVSSQRGHSFVICEVRRAGAAAAAAHTGNGAQKQVRKHHCKCLNAIDSK